MALGALGVHDLRYLLAYGGDAGEELSLQGHAYLRLATPVVAGFVVLAAAAFLSRVVRAFEGEAAGGAPLPRAKCVWALLSSLLITVYCSQEWIEGQLAEGHPGGLGAPFDHGGWLALPLAVAIGLLIMLALRGATTVLAAASRRRRRRIALFAPVLAASPLARSLARVPSADELARRLAPRAPPASG